MSYLKLLNQLLKFRYLRMVDWPQKLLTENSSINVELSKNKTGEVTAEAHLLLTAEIVNSVQQIRIGGLLNANYNLGLIWGIDCITILVLLVKMKMAIYDLMHLIHCTHWKIIWDEFITMPTRWLYTFNCNL